MRLRTIGVGAAVGAAVCLAGCGGPRPSAPPASTSTSPVATPSTTPSATPAPTASGTAVASAPLSSRVLAATDLPAALTGTRGPVSSDAVVGRCNRVSLLTIGATRTAAASYAGPGHTVISQVARVADPATATRMAATLRSLHDKCALPTTPVAPVPAAGTTAWRYLADLGKGRVDAFGVAASGNLMTVVAVTGPRALVSARIDGLLATAADRL